MPTPRVREHSWLRLADAPLDCHPEQSEGSGLVPAPRYASLQTETQIPRFARDANPERAIPLCCHRRRYPAKSLKLRVSRCVHVEVVESWQKLLKTMSYCCGRQVQKTSGTYFLVWQPPATHQPGPYAVTWRNVYRLYDGFLCTEDKRALNRILEAHRYLIRL